MTAVPDEEAKDRIGDMALRIVRLMGRSSGDLDEDVTAVALALAYLSLAAARLQGVMLQDMLDRVCNVLRSNAVALSSTPSMQCLLRRLDDA